MVLIILVIIIMAVILSALIMGILNFLLWAFGLAITITFWQALAISLVLIFIANLFRGGKK